MKTIKKEVLSNLSSIILDDKTAHYLHGEARRAIINTLAIHSGADVTRVWFNVFAEYLDKNYNIEVKIKTKDDSNESY